HEERIAEYFPQSIDRVADRRLLDGEPPGRKGKGTKFVYGAQGQERAKIHIRSIGFLHIGHSNRLIGSHPSSGYTLPNRGISRICTECRCDRPTICATAYRRWGKAPAAG